MVPNDSPGQPADINIQPNPPSESTSVAPDNDNQSGPPLQIRKKDPLKRGFWLAVFILVILIALIINASYTNTGKYYLKVAAGAVEIWQGTFSPAGKKRLLIMPGVIPPAEIQSVYTQAEIYPLIFQYYIDKADMLINLPGMPDFSGIKSYLNQSLVYVTEETQRHTAITRLNAVDRIILLYKADVAAGKGSKAGLTAARKYLKSAAELDPDEIQANLIKQKLTSIQEIIETMDSTESKESNSLPPDESAVEQDLGK